MDPLWLNFASFLAVYIFAIVSPGPNFILVVNSALSSTRRTGLVTALGVATGSGLFGLAGLLGVIVLIQSLPNFAILSRLIGGGYLVWLGIDMVRLGRRGNGAAGGHKSGTVPSSNALTAWRTGLFTNLTNPKAWAFYIALFTVVLSPGFQFWHKVLLNLSMFFISFFWYGFVAYAISSPRFRPVFQKVQPSIQFILGVLLLAIGGRMFIQG